jgi:hypothetical protein
MFLPVGAVAGNEETVRASNASAFFYTFGDILRGTDDQLILDGSTRNDGLLGPSSTLGIDVGVGTNGEVYIRGTTINNGASTPASTRTVAAQPRVTPVMLLIGGLVLFVLLRK